MKKKILRLLPLLCYVSLIIYASCSGNDEPKPFDCATSDLAISLAANGDKDPSNCNTADGSVTVTATGGKEPYKFSIGTGSFGTSAEFTGLGSGTFLITVQDAHKCTKNLSVTIAAPGAPEVDLVKTEDTNCLSPFNGSITVNATGGSGTLQYKLDNLAFGSTTVFENLKAGQHVITVKDEGECVVTISTIVEKGSTGITYTNDILPIFEAKCNFSGCHPENGDWFTYSVAFQHRDDIKRKTGAGEMPKDGGAGQGGPLSAVEIAKIACWVDDEAPQ